MFLEILACVGVYSLVKGISVELESSEHESNFIAHMNRSRDALQNQHRGQIGCPIGSNPREYWEDRIRQGQCQDQRKFK